VLAHIQKLVSIVRMVTMLEECGTEEQHSVVRFYGQNYSIQRIFMKKCFLFMVGSVCRLKRFSLGGKCFADDEEVEMEVRNWLRQQSERGHIKRVCLSCQRSRKSPLIMSLVTSVGTDVLNQPHRYFLVCVNSAWGAYPACLS
jgi:hypothetical protein